MNSPSSVKGFWQDTPTTHTVIRNGRETRVYLRTYDECMGGGERFITLRSKRDEKAYRQKYGIPTVVNLPSWYEVFPEELPKV